jgi:hypothetical protein
MIDMINEKLNEYKDLIIPTPHVTHKNIKNQLSTITLQIE